jgi:hypothetical protein
MVALLCLFLKLVTSPLRPLCRLESENAALRHQLVVLQRKVRGRIELTNGDRLFFILLYRWFPLVLRAMVIVRCVCRKLHRHQLEEGIALPPRMMVSPTCFL